MCHITEDALKDDELRNSFTPLQAARAHQWQSAGTANNNEERTFSPGGPGGPSGPWGPMWPYNEKKTDVNLITAVCCVTYARNIQGVTLNSVIDHAVTYPSITL